MEAPRYRIGQQIIYLDGNSNISGIIKSIAGNEGYNWVYTLEIGVSIAEDEIIFYVNKEQKWVKYSTPHFSVIE